MTSKRLSLRSLAAIALFGSTALAAQPSPDRAGYGARNAEAGSALRQQAKTLRALVAHFRAAGLRVGAVDGTDDIAGIEIGGRKVSVFRFAAPDERAILAEVRRAGALEVAGDRYPALVNGVWVLGIDRDHPQWRAIEAAFRSF